MIPKPKKNKQGNVMGDFYPLQREELMAMRKAKLINNTAFVHLALRYENPFCDKAISLIPKEFALRWQIPESSVYEAVGKLKSCNAIALELLKIYDNPEYQVVKRLQTELGGQTEVVTAIGRIDLLTETEIIEVKQVSDWKAALGQILTYSGFFPEHTKRIHLFGDCTPQKKEVICSTLLSFDVIATFEEVGG
jgi:hypothetical protein